MQTLELLQRHLPLLQTPLNGLDDQLALFLFAASLDVPSLGLG